MELRDSFKAFVNRVMHAARLGKLGTEDIKVLESLLGKTKKKNLILSRAILGSLSGGLESPADVQAFARLLDKANKNIGEANSPFSNEDRTSLEQIFLRHSLSIKAAKRFALNIDQLLVNELRDEMGKREGLFPKKVDDSKIWKDEGRKKLVS